MTSEVKSDNNTEKDSGILWREIIFLGFIIYITYPYWAKSVPDMEVPQELNNLINLECERDQVAISCVMTNKRDYGVIQTGAFSSLYYDKDGVRLGANNFPSQNILPGESIKDNLIVYSDLSDIEKIKIGYR
ncbi:hypothetical protein GO003_024070 [Methylicorpusculum oleiharenae]|uniref:hypothetical protein n=1 Tax=Methylicorpusculum oleiharenae TaxID=1338687 RepID=UPI00135888A8|nr:hypothetical protein [Methylicorpusculum oleiharenae]MCD2453461.1 hypothetical protein [Methylicorpusculum oleiharenae]